MFINSFNADLKPFKMIFRWSEFIFCFVLGFSPFVNSYFKVKKESYQHEQLDLPMFYESISTLYLFSKVLASRVNRAQNF